MHNVLVCNSIQKSKKRKSYTLKLKLECNVIGLIIFIATLVTVATSRATRVSHVTNQKKVTASNQKMKH